MPRPFSKQETRRCGFSLVEMLVVLGIIILVISLLIPAVMNARRASRQTQCASNLRQIGALLIMYANANNDFVPMSYNGFYPPVIDPNVHFAPDLTNYVMLWGKPGACLGPLVTDGTLRDGSILYCPADANEKMVWSTAQSVFPRPAQEPPDVCIRSSYFPRTMPPMGGFSHHFPPNPPEVNYGMARLDSLLHKSMYTERSFPASHGTRGNRRMNVLYFDDSVLSRPVKEVINPPEGDDWMYGPIDPPTKVPARIVVGERIEWTEFDLRDREHEKNN